MKTTTRAAVILLGLLALCGCASSQRAGPRDSERIQSLCDVLRAQEEGSADRDARDRAAWAKFYAAVDLGALAAHQRLPPFAYEALREAATNDYDIEWHIDYGDPCFGGTGWDMRLRVGDGALIARLTQDLAGAAHDGDRMQMLWQTYLLHPESQALRLFCAAHLAALESEGVVPYLTAAAAHLAVRSRIEPRWLVVRLGEFYPLSSDCLLALTRLEDEVVAQVAVDAIEGFGRPWDWKLETYAQGEKPESRASAWEPPLAAGAAAAADEVHITLEESYEGPSRGRPEIARVIREALARVGVQVSRKRGATNGGTALHVDVQGSLLSAADEADADSDDDFDYATLCPGAAIKGRLVLSFDGRRHAVSFNGERRYIPLSPLPKLGPPSFQAPYIEAFALSDFIPRLAEALSALTGKSKICVLGSLLYDRDWRIQLGAAWALSETRDAHAVPELVALLREHPNWLAGAGAAHALSQIGAARGAGAADPTIVHALVGGVGPGNAWQVRCISARALGTCGRVPLDRMLSGLQWDNCWLVRRNIAWALGRLGDKGAADALARAAQEDGDARVRDEARAALISLGDSSGDTCPSRPDRGTGPESRK